MDDGDHEREARDLVGHGHSRVANALRERDQEIGELVAQRDAARLQADEWKRYAQALDAGVGTTTEERLAEARGLVRRLSSVMWGCSFEAGFFAEMGVSPSSDAAIKEAHAAFDDAAKAIATWV